MEGHLASHPSDNDRKGKKRALCDATEDLPGAAAKLPFAVPPEVETQLFLWGSPNFSPQFHRWSELPEATQRVASRAPSWGHRVLSPTETSTRR